MTMVSSVEKAVLAQPLAKSKLHVTLDRPDSTTRATNRRSDLLLGALFIEA